MRTLVCILLLVLPVIGLLAQNPDISVQFTPADIYVNSFKTASFDPETPWTQPIMTILQIANTSANTFRFYMRVEISWSGVSGTLVQATYISTDVLAAGMAFPPLTNQDLITSQASVPFNQVGSINFSLDDIVNRSDILKQAVMAGYFPDGIISINVRAQPESSGYTNWNNASSGTFNIHVRTAGSITTLIPGAPIGEPIPVASSSPLTYLWNSLDTEFNSYQLTIREYPSNNPPQIGNVGNSGSVIFEQYTSSFTFNEYLPYVPGNYYAWRVSTTRYTELNPHLGAVIWRDTDESIISSEWRVFRYMLPQGDEDWQSRFNAALSSLDMPEIRELLDSGYMPSEGIVYQGKALGAQEAAALLESLAGKKLQIKVWE